MTPQGPEDFDEADAALGVDVLFFAPVEGGGVAPDLDPYFTLIAGPQGVAQRAALGLLGTTGKLRDAPDRTFDIRDHINMIQTKDGVDSLRGKIAAEVARDEEVLSVDVTIKPDPAAASMDIAIDGLTAAGPFSLVMAVDALDARVLRAA